jgi:hypothetical protein
MDTVLSKSELKSAQEALYKCNQAQEQIEAAEACGLDCTEERDRCQHLKTFLTGVVATYRPKPGSR